VDANELQRMKEQMARDFDPTRYPDPAFGEDGDRYVIIQTTVTGLSVDFGTRKYNDVIKWGAHVADSEIRLHNPKKCHFFCATLERCNLVAIQTQNEPNWSNMHWIDCRFKGVYRGCLLGRASDAKCFHRPLTRMERCDFSMARLDGCAFLNTDPREITWPELPHVIVCEPWRHIDAILGISPDWPLQGFLQSVALANEELSAMALSKEWLQEWLSEPDVERFIVACRQQNFIELNF
jgi:hypothetical protein